MSCVLIGTAHTCEGCLMWCVNPAKKAGNAPFKHQTVHDQRDRERNLSCQTHVPSIMSLERRMGRHLLYSLSHPAGGNSNKPSHPRCVISVCQTLSKHRNFPHTFSPVIRKLAHSTYVMVMYNNFFLIWLLLCRSFVSCWVSAVFLMPYYTKSAQKKVGLHVRISRVSVRISRVYALKTFFLGVYFNKTFIWHVRPALSS